MVGDARAVVGHLDGEEVGFIGGNHSHLDATASWGDVYGVHNQVEHHLFKLLF
jgi:hypothetical protein